jgi:membrane-associated phospholipid phosphatase
VTAAPGSGTPSARREATRAVLLPRGHGHHRRGADALHAGIGAAGVAATAALAAEQGLSGFERDVFEAVNGLPQTATPGLWVVMQAGSLAAVFVTAGLALAARRPRLALALAAGGTTTWLLAKVVKQLVERGRPEALLHDVVVYGPAATGLGFPSGHAAVAAAIMTVAGPYLTGRARVAGWVAVGVVAFTRVLIGAHFPLDALGGLLLGWAVGSATNLVLGRPGAAEPD